MAPGVWRSAVETDPGVAAGAGGLPRCGPKLLGVAGWREAGGRSGGHGASRGGGDVSVAAEHSNPARGVALDQQGLVVGSAVVVGPAGLEHGVDDAQHLVGSCDDGALVAAPGGEGTVAGFELATPGSGGAMGALDQGGAQGGGALASTRHAALARAFVVARAKPGPGHQGFAGAEGLDVGSEFDQDGAGRRAVNAGDGGEKTELCLPWVICSSICRV